MNADKLISSNKHIKNLFRQRIEAFFGTTPAENMAFPLAATFASGFICRNFSGVMWLEVTAVAVMLVSWALSSLLSGFLKQWYFIIFSSAVNFLPYLFFNAEAENASEVNRVLVAVCEFISYYSVEPVLNLGIEAFTVSAAIAAASGIFMLTGFIIRKNARSSREYCKVRLNMLGGTEN